MKQRSQENVCYLLQTFQVRLNSHLLEKWRVKLKQWLTILVFSVCLWNELVSGIPLNSDCLGYAIKQSQQEYCEMFAEGKVLDFDCYIYTYGYWFNALASIFIPHFGHCFKYGRLTVDIDGTVSFGKLKTISKICFVSVAEEILAKVVEFLVFIPPFQDWLQQLREQKEHLRKDFVALGEEFIRRKEFGLVT